MLRKPTKSESICLAIGVALALILVRLISPTRRAEKTPLTVLIPYDSTRQRLVVKADSGKNKLIIFQERIHQLTKTYESKRICFDSIAVELP